MLTTDTVSENFGYPDQHQAFDGKRRSRMSVDRATALKQDAVAYFFPTAGLKPPKQQGRLYVTDDGKMAACVAAASSSSDDRISMWYGLAVAAMAACATADRAFFIAVAELPNGTIQRFCFPLRVRDGVPYIATEDGEWLPAHSKSEVHFHAKLEYDGSWRLFLSRGYHMLADAFASPTYYSERVWVSGHWRAAQEPLPASPETQREFQLLRDYAALVSARDPAVAIRVSLVRKA